MGQGRQKTGFKGVLRTNRENCANRPIWQGAGRVAERARQVPLPEDQLRAKNTMVMMKPVSTMPPRNTGTGIRRATRAPR